jgi:hypothetical protein
MKILVSIITTNKDYLKNIEDLQKFKIKEVALFFTLYATKTVRQKIYKKLIKNNITSVPVVHLRSDMKLDEIEYLIKTFKTKAFNTHPRGFYELKDEKALIKYKKQIYIEHLEIVSIKEEIKNFAGICLDTSHLHDAYLKKCESYKETIKLLKTHKCGFAHIGAIRNGYISPYSHKLEYGDHFFRNLNEFNYLKKYKKYLPKYLALEINNNIEEQIKAKKYIQKLLK